MGWNVSITLNPDATESSPQRAESSDDAHSTAETLSQPPLRDTALGAGRWIYAADDDEEEFFLDAPPVVPVKRRPPLA